MSTKPPVQPSKHRSRVRGWLIGFALALFVGLFIYEHSIMIDEVQGGLHAWDSREFMIAFWRTLPKWLLVIAAIWLVAWVILRFRTDPKV